MATTVTTATLQVDVVETITLNGITYDKTTTNSIASIAQYSVRVMQLAASGNHAVYTAAASPAGSAHDSDDVRYIRITNLDDTNPVTVSINSAGNDAVALNLIAGASIVLFDDKIEGNATGGAITTQPLVSVVDSIYVTTSANETDIELVTASV